MSDFKKLNEHSLAFEELQRKYGITDMENLNDEQKARVEEYFLINHSDSKPFYKNIIKKLMRGNRENSFQIYISGLTGLGKSSYLNFLFDIELPTSRFGTGTTSRIVRETQIASMKIIVIDPEGLGNAQEGNETTMTHNISDIRDQLTGQNNVINTLIQAFNFIDNRFKDEEKVQLRNILENIDFTKPEQYYLKIVSKLLIVFLKANCFITNNEVEDKLYELDEIDSSTENQEEIIKIKNLIKDINNLFQTQFDNQVSKVKSMIMDILKVIAPHLDNSKMENIISKINFTYAGKILPNGSVDTIPSKKRLRLSDDMLEKNNIKLWNDNWRINNFNLILGNTDNTYAYSLKQAIKDRSKVNLTTYQDSHDIENAKVENFYKLDHKSKQNIRAGKKQIWINSIKQFAKVSSATGAGGIVGGIGIGALGGATVAASLTVAVPFVGITALLIGAASAFFKFW